MSDILEKIDAIRKRLNVSYQQAKDALDASKGDVVQALALLEKKGQGWTERIQVTGSELVAKVKELIKEGNVRKIVVKQDDKIIFELPLTLGAIGAIVAPQLAALGALAALVTHCTVELERVKGDGDTGDSDAGGRRCP